MMRRRALLGVLGSVGLVGCLQFGDVEGVLVLNTTDEMQRYAITVTRLSDEAVVLDAESRLGPAGVGRYQAPATRAEPHRVSIETADGVVGETDWPFNDEHAVLVARLTPTAITFEELVS